MANNYVDLPKSTGGGVGSDVNIHDSSGNVLGSTGGALNVDIVGGTVIATNPSVGPTAAIAPTSATEVGGINPEGNLTSLSVSDNGFLNVNSIGSSTVTGTVTSNEAGLADYKTTQYPIGTSEVQLAPTPLTNRSSVSFKVHTSSGTDFVLFAQAPGVAATNGYRLDDGESMQMDLTGTGSIYVVGSSAGQLVYLLEIA